MILNALAAATMLLWVNFVPTSNVKSVEPTFVAAPAIEVLQKMTSETEIYLIEEEATSLFLLTVDDAWYKYNNGELTITELAPDQHYLLELDHIIEEVYIDN